MTLSAIPGGLGSLPVLHEGSKLVVYLLERGQGVKPAAIKVLKKTAPEAERRRLSNEYEMSHALDAPGLRRARELTEIEGRQALILDYAEGETVLEAFVRRRRGLAESLALARSMASALAALHRAGLVHGGIGSANVIAGRERPEATLIDLGRAFPADAPREGAEGEEPPEDALPYLPPEQTGRVRWPVDRRADLYSLGVVLYEVLTGRLPFAASSAAELIHCHIARLPTPPSKIDAGIPPAVSGIVMKLLSKNPQDRYQSASGLKADLERTLEGLEREGVVPSFELGSEDRTGTLQHPQRLLGRERESRILSAALDQARDGFGELVLVSGPAGVGKTSLVCALEGMVRAEGGYFISGQHDEYDRNAPYAALLQALIKLVDLVLKESAEELALWKASLALALGINAGILAEAIPRLGLILGEMPVATNPDSPEASKRLLIAFQALLKAAAERHRPLVVFIDNMQWADAAAVGLYVTLLSSADAPRLLFIGAYRDTEIYPSHPLGTAVRALARLRPALRMIALGNLSPSALGEMVALSLTCDSAKAKSLAEGVYGKTSGNPLFAIQYLQSLREEGLLAFDPDRGEWRWSADRIRATIASEDAAALMLRQVEELPAKT
ncbi:MAG: AAA family ATPase, partial [Spirochaetaceae bacterium]|nr:AAA family ATPase [Spirochaetaceae bacterium]